MGPNKKKIYCIIISLVVFVMGFKEVNSDAELTNQNKKIKVGFYQYGDYYYYDENKNPKGYYNDLLELIVKDLGINYEYIEIDLEDVMNKLENGNVDLLLGINQTPERLKKFIYTDHQIEIEKYGLYTNKNISYGNLEDLGKLKLAYIKNEANFEWIINFLQTRGIKVELVPAKTYEETVELLKNKKVDATVSTIGNKMLTNEKMIFQYSAGPVYIASSKGNEKLIGEINKVIEKYSCMKKNPMQQIHNSYFNEYAKNNKYMNLLIIVLILSIIIVITNLKYKKEIPKRKLRKKQHEIRELLKNDKYLLYYQPIINPKCDSIKGFEALLRMKYKDKILTPYHFLSYIEDSDMMYEVTLWILEKVISDYNIIKEYKNVKKEEFYISVNVSFKDMENDNFIKQIKNLIKRLDVKPNTICLEIVEKFAMNDIEKIKESIITLKENGIMVAIDDFGVEYSNLDILEKVECDIIKLDKYFIDNIDKSIVRREIIKFLSHLCEISNKVLICEGVEETQQRDLIKNTKNNKFYIQGYFYSEPLSIKDLKEFKVNNKKSIG